MMKALSINASLVENNPHDNTLAQNLLDTYYQTSSLYEEVNDSLSLSYLLKALKLAEASVRSDEANTQARQNLSKAYTKFGVSYNRLKKSEEAITYLEKALAMLAELEKLEPLNRTYKRLNLVQSIIRQFIPA